MPNRQALFVCKCADERLELSLLSICPFAIHSMLSHTKHMHKSTRAYKGERNKGKKGNSDNEWVGDEVPSGVSATDF